MELQKINSFTAELWFNIPGDIISNCLPSSDIAGSFNTEYYGTAEPPVRCGESHLSGLTEPLHFVY